ncbi:MAG: hypothetical protein A3I10_07735 [Deltaproteobacteria bacterium RIFCSPLOWO2_02_FULL_57_26]|nr:MAG: hypothetical protein A3I10_07735 [Deltaproteobacteria bacterium RIFCSPLOWO2_02_FULL_57_26]
MRNWRLRGINHEGAQSVKTAERLGLLRKEVQAFLFSRRRAISFQLLYLADSRGLTAKGL